MGIIDRLFDVKKIVSREGHVHFRRWRLVRTPWFSVFVHQIAKSDEDDPHDHPWPFLSFILSGGYSEVVRTPDGRSSVFKRRPASLVFHPTTHFHNITLFKGQPAWTLVFTGARTHDLWGYWTDDGWVDHVTYRKRKNEARPV